MSHTFTVLIFYISLSATVLTDGTAIAHEESTGERLATLCTYEARLMPLFAHSRHHRPHQLLIASTALHCIECRVVRFAVELTLVLIKLSWQTAEAKKKKKVCQSKTHDMDYLRPLRTLCGSGCIGSILCAISCATL